MKVNQIAKCCAGMCLYASMLVACIAGEKSTGQDESPACRLADIQGRGVYWPWERTEPSAKESGKELWQFVDDTMKVLKNDLHCNIIWFVNCPGDTANMSRLAEKNGLKVLFNAGLVGYSYNGFSRIGDIRATALKTSEKYKGNKAVAGYILKDEPKLNEIQQMESWNRIMREADPERDCILVSMTQQTEGYALETTLPVVCSDIYHFGGNRSPNIPNPSSASQRSCRGAVSALVELAEKNGKKAWLMPQAFSEYWGLWSYDENGNTVIEPGTYVHWKMPSPAEIKWQTWEGIRAGCKSVLFFVLLSGQNKWKPGMDPDKENTRVFNQMKGMGKTAAENKWPLCAEKTKIEGAQALLDAKGALTAQAKAMGDSFGKIEKVEKLIPSLEVAEFPAVFADAPFKVNTFCNPGDPRVRYAVMVNDNISSPACGKLFFLSNSAGIQDMISGKELVLKSSDIPGFICSELELAPGDGTVLKITFKDNEPGINLFKENFELASLKVQLENASRVQEARGFGMGFQNLVRRDCKEKDKASKIIIPDLRKKGGPGGSVLLGTLDSPNGNVYFKVDGNFPKPESLVISTVNKEGKSVWLLSNNYHLPVIVPKDTEKIELTFTGDAAIKSLGFWFVPNK